MAKIVIVSAARTPIGKFLGGLSSYSAPQLGGFAIRAAIERAGVKAADVDEIIMGNAIQAGLYQNPARQAALAAGLPKTVNAFTVNKVCGSGLKAVMLAAQAVRAGDADVVVAGGMESMSNAPFIVRNLRSRQKLGDCQLLANDDQFSLLDQRTGKTSTFKEVMILEDAMVRDGLWDCYSDCHMGTLAETLTKSRKIDREEQDRFALASHQKAVAAIDAGTFAKEIVSVGDVTTDEGPRRDTSFEKLSSLDPFFRKDGTITAGNASTINDGAAALVVMSQSKAAELKCEPLCSIEGYAAAHLDPAQYMVAPVAAVQKLMQKTKRTIPDYDLIELNEAFAVQSLAVMKELAINPEKLNVHGGAIALGHPIGCSGARVLVTLVHALRAKGGKRGLATLCLGGGGAVAMEIKV